VLLEQGAQAGVFPPEEQQLVESVFEFADDRVTALMTPRPDIAWLDLEDPLKENRRRIAENRYSLFPVCRGELDKVARVVRVKDLLVGALTGHDPGPEECLREPLFVPEGMLALRMLEEFRRSGGHLALVVDEYGGTAGLVTMKDVLDAIVGHIPSAGSRRIRGKCSGRTARGSSTARCRRTRSARS
jgi:putative hemolysin